MKKYILLNTISVSIVCILLFAGCDVIKGSWTETGPLHHERSAHSATLLLDGRVLIAGGFDLNSNRQTSAELFDPVAGSWAKTSPLHIGRGGHTATLLPDRNVLVAGGFSYVNVPHNSAEIYQYTK
jgi:predicted small secreted protein